MKIITKGLMLAERNLGESDKIITVLTENRGIMRCFAKGAKSIKSTMNSGTNTFCYSRLSAYPRGDKFLLGHTEPLHTFFALNSNIEKLALAQYFSELLINIVPEYSEPESSDAEGGVKTETFLRLALNTLYFIEHEKHPRSLIKAAFELRLLSLAGFMPNLMCCDRCGRYESDVMYFSCGEDRLLCKGCYSGERGFTPLCISAVMAMRHSIYSDFEKLFAFNISGAALAEFADTSERLILSVVGRGLVTLDFYKVVSS